MSVTEIISVESDRRREETIDKTSRCLTRSSKPQKNDPFYLIPDDLKVEILMKLSAKTIPNLILASKSWLPIIYGRDFTKVYLNRSLARPCPLFTIYRHDQQKQYFHSCSQKKPCSDHQRVHNTNDRYDFSPPVHGLICYINGDNDVTIGNPTTGQFVTLLRLKTWEGSIYSFLGFDPVNDVYKVLCVKVKLSLDVLSAEHQVLNLGVTQKWRTIECKHPHYPTPGTKGICINGVVYYLARVDKRRSLICFNLTYEDFSVIKLRKSGQFIANYNGKVAISNVLYKGKLDLWVLEDAKKQEWSKVSILDPSWANLYITGSPFGFKFSGTLSTGELIFAPYSYCDWVYLLCYDPKNQKFEKFQLRGFGNIPVSVEVFLDHIESPMFLSKVS